MNTQEFSPRNFLNRRLNQRVSKIDAENARRVFGVPNKASRAVEKTEAFLNNLPQIIFDRSLQHVVEGRATFEDVDYIRRHQQDFVIPEGINIIDSVSAIKGKLYS